MKVIIRRLLPSKAWRYWVPLTGRKQTVQCFSLPANRPKNPESTPNQSCHWISNSIPSEISFIFMNPGPLNFWSCSFRAWQVLELSWVCQQLKAYGISPDGVQHLAGALAVWMDGWVNHIPSLQSQWRDYIQLHDGIPTLLWTEDTSQTNIS